MGARQAPRRTRFRQRHGRRRGARDQVEADFRARPASPPLINTHRLYCDAKFALFVVVEQDPSGEDEVVVDLSTLRLERDAPVRARLLQLAADFGDAILATDDLCADIGEPIDDRVRYLRAIDTSASASASEVASAAADGSPIALEAPSRRRSPKRVRLLTRRRVLCAR